MNDSKFPRYFIIIINNMMTDTSKNLTSRKFRRISLALEVFLFVFLSFQ